MTEPVAIKRDVSFEKMMHSLVFVTVASENKNLLVSAANACYTCAEYFI